MFTLRFCTDTDYQWVVATSEYAKDIRDGFAFIIAKGVEYRVGGLGKDGHKPYAVCFIENQAGKTIDRIGPYPPAHTPNVIKV